MLKSKTLSSVGVLAFLILVLSGCSFTFSPPIQNYYIPMYPDSTNVFSLGIELYNWPLTLNRIRPYYDTTLIFFDTHSSALIGNTYIPFFDKGTIKLGFNPFIKTGIWHGGSFDRNTGLSHDYFALIGGGIRVLPHIVTPHYVVGASFVPFAGGFVAGIISNDTIQKDITTGFTIIPEMLSSAGVYAYYVTGNTHLKFYTGPFFQIYVPTMSGGINNGIVFYKNGKEAFRLSLSTAYFKDETYTHYNLFPLAFMLSLWKTF